jgi:hypothetical protein
MKTGIHLKVIWVDEVEDLLEVTFSCSNGYFSGEAEIYTSRDALSQLATTLRGFPSRLGDSRNFELGTFNPAHADGGARMSFLCVDAAGHSVVEVRIRSGACKGMGEVHSVALRVPIQAAGIGDFVKQLQHLDKEIGANACLPHAVS